MHTGQGYASPVAGPRTGDLGARRHSFPPAIPAVPPRGRFRTPPHHVSAAHLAERPGSSPSMLCLLKRPFMHNHAQFEFASSAARHIECQVAGEHGEVSQSSRWRSRWCTDARGARPVRQDYKGLLAGAVLLSATMPTLPRVSPSSRRTALPASLLYARLHDGVRRPRAADWDTTLQKQVR